MYSTHHILLQSRCNFNVTQPNIHPMSDTRISISNPWNLTLVREQMFKSPYLHNSCQINVTNQKMYGKSLHIRSKHFKLHASSTHNHEHGYM